MRFADGREPAGGVAFIVSGAAPRAITSSHLVLNLAKTSTLAKLDLADAKSGAVEASATELAASPGAGFDGFDYSDDVAVLDLDRVPAGAAVFDLAAERPKPGDAAEIVACPADRSASEVSVRGTVIYAGADRVEVDVDPTVNARGFAGAPVVSWKTGKVVGIVQNAVGRNGRGLLLATPAEALRAAVERADRPGAKVPLERWRR
jgi:hypothetical protein